MKRAILIKSCQKNLGRSDACEATWAGELRRRGVIVAIIEGGARGDIIGSGWGRVSLECGDEYNDNSFKLQMAIRAMLQFLPFDHLFICDDDTFIHPQRWLSHEPAGEFECRLYCPQSPRDHKLNNGRPWACGGAGWWMSRRVCELYVDRVTHVCSWDDVLATAIAQDAGIPITDRPDLYGCERYGATAGDNFITYHPAEPPEMMRLWESVCG